MQHMEQAKGSPWKRLPSFLSLKKNVRRGDVKLVEQQLAALQVAYEGDASSLLESKLKPLNLVHIAAEEGQLETIAVLLEYGADPDLRNSVGLTPLMMACRGGHATCAALLVGKGADVFCKDGIHGWSSLHYACVGGSLSCLKLLIDTCKTVLSSIERSLSVSAYLNIRDSRGISALHLAAICSSLPIVRLLLEEGALVSPRVASGVGCGSTALHLSARTGDVAIIKELLIWGARRTDKDVEGRTPYTVALLYGHTTVAGILNPQAPEPLIWPSERRCSSMAGLAATTRKVLEKAMEDFNKNRVKEAKEGLRRGLRQGLSHNRSRGGFILRRIGRSLLCGRTKRQSSYSDDGKAGELFSDSQKGSRMDRSASKDVVGTVEEEQDLLCGICFERKCDIELRGCGHSLCATCTISICCHMKPVKSFEEPNSLLCPFCRGEVVTLSIVA